ncbi:Putative SOS response-associated peptidase YedK [Pseudarthrobacter enclensis]|nr:Putative SOS response-associated peptidase YedK [Pseudarthrobacter enclensis]
MSGYPPTDPKLRRRSGCWSLELGGFGQNGLMCGRYVMSKATGDLLSAFEAKEVEGTPPPPSWNVAPTQDVPIVAERLDEGTLDRHLLVAHWGLVPSWAKDIKIGNKLINARSESILEKPSFRKAAVKRRCLVPAEGYYEWQKTDDGKKIPNYLYSEQDELLAFAGLYEWWADPTVPEDDPGKWLLSCTVLTTTTQDTLGHIHDRSPVIIPRDRINEWLDPDLADKNDVQHLLDTLPDPVLTPRIVSTRVNSVRNNGPELIEPAQ